MRRLLCLLSLAFAPWGATATVGGSFPAESVQTQWMGVLLSGRKIGQLTIERRVDATTVTTTQTLALELNRNGHGLRLGNMSRSVENLDGAPIGFAASTHLSAQDSTVEGHRNSAGEFDVATTVGGQQRMRRITWPTGALMAEAQRRAILAAGRRPGTHYNLRSFDPASQQVQQTAMDVLGDEWVALPGGTVRLSHQRQTLAMARGIEVYDLWFDDEGIARKGRMEMIGKALELVACDRACASAPNQSVDMFRAAMVDSPRTMNASLRATPMRYRIRLLDADPARPFIDTGEQRVTPIPGGDLLIDVGTARPGIEASPQPADSQPNDWLQADAPEVRALAAQAVGDADDARGRMRRLRSFVSAYITEHGLDVGYASALETVRNRRGDCTEYAVLLAALARAQGIPARVVTGMVYVDRFGGAQRVFVPHAWVQAWIDGRWESYDAALRRFDSTHLAMTTGDGDPWRFFAGSQRFDRIRIDDARPAQDIMAMPADGGPAPAAAPATGGGVGR